MRNDDVASDTCEALGPGRWYSRAALVFWPRSHRPGREVQVDPIKPNLKPPGTKRLKPKHNDVLSSSAFNFNLRCYIPVCWRKRSSPSRGHSDKM
jgi:hypothetical protein